MNEIQFHKSKLVDSIDIDHSLLEAMIKLNEGLHLMAFVSSDRTRLHGCLQMTDLLSYMTTHWSGTDVECFKIPLKNLDMLFQTQLIRCKESDTLFQVLRKMRD